MTKQVILGLGSNLGNRQDNLRSAVYALSEYVKHIRESRIIESKALLPENAPKDWDKPYFNMAIIGETKLLPQDLLLVVKAIEKTMGREDAQQWSPRVIDIDILAYGNEVVNEPNLVIPHSELMNRDFALKPLLELAPDWRHPLSVNK